MFNWNSNLIGERSTVMSENKEDAIGGTTRGDKKDNQSSDTDLAGSTSSATSLSGSADAGGGITESGASGDDKESSPGSAGDWNPGSHGEGGSEVY
jgi:hypothetical protein